MPGDSKKLIMLHRALFIVQMKPEVDAKLARLRQHVFKLRKVW